MPSEAQLRANRQNAQRSTGPRTTHGKDRSRFNATKHALTAKLVVLPYEDLAAYEALHSALMDEYDPQSPSEAFLVDQLAQSWWRLNRSRRYETGMLTNLGPHATDPGPSPKDLDHHRRYEAAIERAYYRAYDRIERVKNRRKRSVSPDIELAPAEPEPAASITIAAAAQPEQIAPITSIGFVSRFQSAAIPTGDRAPDISIREEEPRKCA